MDKSSNRPLCSVLVPTRGRPGEALACAESFLSLASDASRVEVVVRGHLSDAETMAGLLRAEGVRVMAGDDEDGYASMDHFVNSTAAVANGCWLWPSADDMRCRTRGWDEVLAAQCAAPVAECWMLVPLVVNMTFRTITVASRGLYEALGHLGQTACADCYLDSLAHFAGIKRKVAIEVEDGGLPWLKDRELMKSWNRYRSEEGARLFRLDKRKLGAVLGRDLGGWTPLDAPENP